MSIITLKDNLIHNVKEKTNVQSKSNLPDDIINRNSAKGFVEIFVKENDNVSQISKQNLILYSGREIVIQRLLNKNRTSGSGEKDTFISWLSVGTGGATSQDPLVPLYPSLNDTGLSSEITIDASNTNYYDSGKKKPFDSIEFLTDESNDNKYLIAKVTTTILKDEGNTNNLNEAALWLSNSTTAGNVNQINIFSRICFSTIEKNNNRELVFVWYLFF